MKIDPLDIRDAIFDEVYKTAKKDKNFIFIADDMDAFSLQKFKKDFPNQYINIGVAEQNMIDVASGLAACGKKVCCFGICSYVTTRCFEQIKFSVCSMNLPVTIIGIGAGFSFNFDGPTHSGLIDLAAMRLLPKMTILNPADAKSASSSISIAYNNSTPHYIRLDKGTFPKFYQSKDTQKGFKIIKTLKKQNIITTGFMTYKVAQILEDLGDKANFGLVDIFRIKPINPSFVANVLKKSQTIISIEENSVIGGLGSLISDLINQNSLVTKLKIMGVKDHQFDQFGSREWLLKQSGLDNISIKKTLLKLQND